MSLNDYLKKDLAFTCDNPNFIEYQLSDFDKTYDGNFSGLTSKEVLSHDGCVDVEYAIYSMTSFNPDSIMEIRLVNPLDNTEQRLKAVFTARYGANISAFAKKGYKLKIVFSGNYSSLNVFKTRLYY